MRKICVINQKGGVGKTTTAVNLAAGLARKKRKVLIIDFDPQGNVSTYLGMDDLGEYLTSYDMLIHSKTPDECLVNVAPNLDLIISDLSLTEAELILSGKPSRETVFKRTMKKLEAYYDYIIVDCPPSIGLLNINALLYCDEAFIPVSTDFLALTGLKKMLHIIDQINDVFEHDLKVSAIIPTLYNLRSKLSKQILEKMVCEFKGIVYDPIRLNAKLQESPASGSVIFDYDKKSRGAEDYKQLVKEVIASE